MNFKKTKVMLSQYLKMKQTIYKIFLQLNIQRQYSSLLDKINKGFGNKKSRDGKTLTLINTFF